jgi:hypothetical protein
MKSNIEQREILSAKDIIDYYFLPLLKTCKPSGDGYSLRFSNISEELYDIIVRKIKESK